MDPKVAIVILNWNKKDCTVSLLESLQEIYYDNFDTIVVDNASTDGSVEALRELHPEIRIIVNPENLGGTGGFNTGIRHVMKTGGYKYLWLLDNDAEVETRTLRELVTTMEEDSTIGIAGSRIVDINSKEITIEAGAFFRWDTIEVKPLFRNERNIKFEKKVEDVDYVAICSALVRISALEKVGLMDDRYFIFWDDMDWGLQFKENNFRVVAVLTSVAYHPLFTEKRSEVVDFYYGCRNALLTYAKHAGILQRLPIYFRYIRYRMKILFFWGLNDRSDLMRMGFTGFLDFLQGNWGRKTFTLRNKEINNEQLHFQKEIKKILFLNTGNLEEIEKAFLAVKALFPDATYDLIMQDDRLDIFTKWFNNTIPIKREKQEKLIYLLIIFFKILFRNYDLAVIPNYPSPFSFAVKKACSYNPISRKLFYNNKNLKNIWKLILSTALGEIIGILLLPFVYVRSLTYNKSYHGQ